MHLIDGDDGGVMLCLIDGQLTGQDAADLAELRQGEPVALQLEAHGLNGGVAELGLAQQVEHGRRFALPVEEEAQGVDAVDHTRHVLLLVDVRRLRMEDRWKTTATINHLLLNHFELNYLI